MLKEFFDAVKKYNEKRNVKYFCFFPIFHSFHWVNTIIMYKAKCKVDFKSLVKGPNKEKQDRYA